MTAEDIDSIRVEITNTGEDFVNNRYTITMTHQDGTKLGWTIPTVLFDCLDWDKAMSALRGELEAKRRVLRNTPWLKTA